MSSKKRRSQKVPFDVKNYAKIEQYFQPISKEQENNPDTPQRKNRLRDVTNTQARRSCSTLENLKDKALKPPKKRISITLDVNRGSENRKYMFTHKENCSLYEALNTVNAIRKEIETQQNKVILVCGREGIEGYINLGMPLSCIPESSHLVITFMAGRNKQGNYQTLYRHDEKVTSDCVKFYIHAVGKERKRIVQHKKLHKKGFKFCVYAIKGETVKEALCKDGRFLSILNSQEWKLIENLDSILESKQQVDDLEGKSFEVEMERSPNAAASQSSESEQRQPHTLNTYIVEEYPSLRQEGEKIREFFNHEMKGKKKKRLFHVHKENFGKFVSNCATMKEHRDFSRFGQSVGYMLWDNNGNSGCGSCFVFRGPYILTCRHVIDLIVGEGVEVGQWAGMISQCVKVTFAYEEPGEREKDYFSIEPWFEVSDKALDYAVLKLKEDGQQMPEGLYAGHYSVPLNGRLRIIGHPDGKVKSTDNCVVIPLSQREEKCQQHVDARAAEGCYAPYVHMQTEKSFKEIIGNPTVITYDTSFYFGSSGSPVFDSKFSLVAMHTAGYKYDYQCGVSSIIEFGVTMKAIIDHMKLNHREWYEDACPYQPDVEMVSDED